MLKLKNIAICMLTWCAALGVANAKEIFEDEKEPVSAKGHYIDTNDTIGGYQIYQGGLRWTMHSGLLSWSGGQADSIPLGELTLSTWGMDGLIAVQSIAANLRINNGAYWSGEPCSGNHVARRILSRGRNDNCMLIDSVAIPIDGTSTTFLRVRTVQSTTSGRYYSADLLVNADYLGVDGSLSTDWTAESVQKDPKKAAAIKKLYPWAERYQEAAARQMDFRRPADTFDAVPDLRVLRADTAKPAIDDSTRAKVASRSKSLVFCEATKTMIDEEDGYCPSTELESAVNPAATKNGRLRSDPVTYVFCEATKTMEPETSGSCSK
jgi:hypothetical protein